MTVSRKCSWSKFRLQLIFKLTHTVKSRPSWCSFVSVCACVRTSDSLTIYLDNLDEVIFGNVLKYLSSEQNSAQSKWRQVCLNILVNWKEATTTAATTTPTTTITATRVISIYETLMELWEKICTTRVADIILKRCERLHSLKWLSKVEIYQQQRVFVRADGRENVIANISRTRDLSWVKLQGFRLC